MFKLLTENNFTTQQKSLGYLQDEHLGNITVQSTAHINNVFHLKYIDTHWKGISENIVTDNETCLIDSYTPKSQMWLDTSVTQLLLIFSWLIYFLISAWKSR